MSRRGLRGNLAVAAAPAAGLGDRSHHALAVETLRIQRRHQIHADRQNMQFIERIARQK